jgi:hypothetical protein
VPMYKWRGEEVTGYYSKYPFDSGFSYGVKSRLDKS